MAKKKFKRRAIIVDIDGTLANAKHREHHIVNPEGKVDWAAWDKEAMNDTVYQWCADLIYAFRLIGVDILFVTGRGERIREVTLDWLDQNACAGPRTKYKLFMRGNGDHRQDVVYKAEVYKNFIEPYYDVLFAIDDKGSVVDMWRALGITCLECDRWTPEMEAAAKKYTVDKTAKGLVK
jgi:predicted secreted acid phosphatase